MIGGVRRCKNEAKDEYLLTELEDSGEPTVFFQRETKRDRPSRISEKSFRKKVGYTSLELREEIGLETQNMSRAAPVCRWHLNLWAWYFNMGGKEP